MVGIDIRVEPGGRVNRIAVRNSVQEMYIGDRPQYVQKIPQGFTLGDNFILLLVVRFAFVEPCKLSSFPLAVLRVISYTLRSHL